MKLQDLISSARDTVSVSRVFGDPIETPDGTFIPVAAVMGGGGAGADREHGEGDAGQGGGGGFRVRPVGAYLVRDGELHYEPAVDITRIVAVVGVVAIAIVVTGARVARVKAKVAARSGKK